MHLDGVGAAVGSHVLHRGRQYPDIEEGLPIPRFQRLIVDLPDSSERAAMASFVCINRSG